jgi:ABC-2 type transport system ATP-binding protein
MLMSETIQAYPILDISAVNASYSKRMAVLNDINFQVHKGEFFGLIGLNGAGKTTLIKSIVTLREQDSGKILINGQDCTLDESKKEIAYLPERFDPPWFLSGIEFIKFSMKLYNQSYDQEKVYSYADQLALDRDALERKVQTYSKGMRQKLGIMATVLTNCNLLILDEPMSGLDPLARSRVKDMLMDMRKDNRTVFLSSHILADMDEICDRIAVLHNGHIQFTGTPAELKEKTLSENLERAFLQHIENCKAA